MNITDYIKNKANLIIENEPSNFHYKMFNTGGVECEVGEFLYGLVKMLKPEKILETGTHFGISSTYIGLALKDNNFGKIITIDPIYYKEAKELHKKMELDGIVSQIELHAEKYETDEIFDFIFLDSEPILRFSEFDKFYKNLKPGGIVIIHDLHKHLSFNSFNRDQPNFKHWPYGDFREKLGKYIYDLDVQTLSFNTPRGITIFQKKDDNMSYIKYLNDELYEKCDSNS